MKKIISFILFIIIYNVHVNAQCKIDEDTLSTHAMRILKQLNSALLCYVQNNTHSPDYGAITCPRCKLYHTRAAEAVYPFAFEYSQTGNETFLKAALL